MSKYKISKKEMYSSYDYIISVPYCELQHLLAFEQEFAYSAWQQWNCDYYDVDGILICTGYNPIKAKRSKSCYEINHKYDEKARELTSKPYINEEEYNNRKLMVRNLLKKYIDEVIKQ